MAEEKTFENKIKKYLKEKRCWYVKYWAGAKFTKSGIPDILACCNGVFLAIEVKSSKGKLSEMQLHNIEKINESGGIAIVLYPSQFEDFKKLVKYILNNKNEKAMDISQKINKKVGA